jgi:hypothetical protein
MSFVIDERLTPLYVINIYDEHMPLATVKRLFAEVDQLLARQGKFGVVMHYKFDEAHPESDDFDKEFDGNLDDDDHEHDHKHKHEPGAAKYQKAWLTANRDRFAQDCVGIAIASANSKFVAFYAPLANRIMSRMYRCPGAMFGDMDKAMTWVQARMPQPVESAASAMISAP